MSADFEGCQSNLDTGWVGRSGRSWSRTAENVILLWVQSGRCAIYTSVSSWNLREYWNSSVISWSHHPWSVPSHPPTQRKTTCYMVASAVFGGVAMQPWCGGKLCMHLEARNITILWQNITQIGSRCF